MGYKKGQEENTQRKKKQLWPSELNITNKNVRIIQ